MSLCNPTPFSGSPFVIATENNERLRNNRANETRTSTNFGSEFVQPRGEWVYSGFNVIAGSMYYCRIKE